mmetsp:Transcript_20010/g.33604  ORF Transcript_20010/g.33604 Transcript_20010/m.33604 type:complete len:199 (+) Transcript_20010:102-698(+)
MLRQAASRFAQVVLKNPPSLGVRAFSGARITDKVMVLTAVGEDRMGKLTSITERIMSHGGSLERSKISRLEGELAMILEIAITEEKGAQLLAALKQEENLQLRPKWIDYLATPPPVTTITVTSLDRPGIVKDVSGFLCEAGFKIENIATRVTSKNGAGMDCFTVDAEVVLPQDWKTMSQAKLVSGLNELGCEVLHFEV